MKDKAKALKEKKRIAQAQRDNAEVAEIRIGQHAKNWKFHGNMIEVARKLGENHANPSQGRSNSESGNKREWHLPNSGLTFWPAPRFLVHG